MKYLRKTLSFILVVILLSGLVFSGVDGNHVVNAQKIDEIEQQMDNLLAEKENIASQKSQSEAELTELQNLKSSSEENLSWLNERSEAQQNAYATLKEKQNNILAIQASYLENLEVAKQQFNAKVEQYGERIEAMFELQDKSIFELFLESDSLEHFFTSVKFMRIITDDDEAALEELETEQEKLTALAEETKNVIDANNVELAEINAVLEDIEADINYKASELSAINTSIDEVEGQIDTFEASEGEIQAALAEAEANIAAIKEAERIAAEEAAAAAAAEAERAAAEGGGYPVESSPGITGTPESPPIYTGGALAWPVPSSYTITSHYGYRTFGGYFDFHTGTDISAPTGTPVVAPASGIVCYSSWMNVGGNTVMIDHGNGMVTMYAHLSGFACSVGQQVTTGQTIAYVGSTGFSTGPHLHYEIRINGSSVNPMTYY